MDGWENAVARAGGALQYAASLRPAISPDEDWTAHDACLTIDPDELFVRGAEQNRAKVRCLACPVRTECLADALDNRTEFGVWGGMTERERRALLRRRPDVTSWRELLEKARREHTTVSGYGIAG
jgi:WhiB family transcriptional regulator, redox-sensing transcriptional regulator